MKKTIPLLTPVFLALTSAASNGALIMISNADFEANGPGFIQATAWIGTNTARVAEHAGNRNQSALALSSDGVTDGAAHFAFTQGTTGPAEQTLTTVFTADFTYTLSSASNYGGGDNAGIIYDIGYDAGAGFVSLGSTTVPQALGGAGTSWARTSSAPTTVAAGDAAIGENIIIRIQSSTNNGVWFDNVELDAVPEPSSALLLSLAALATLGRRRR